MSNRHCGLVIEHCQHQQQQLVITISMRDYHHRVSRMEEQQELSLSRSRSHQSIKTHQSSASPQHREHLDFNTPDITWPHFTIDISNNNYEEHTNHTTLIFITWHWSTINDNINKNNTEERVEYWYSRTNLSVTPLSYLSHSLLPLAALVAILLPRAVQPCRRRSLSSALIANVPSAAVQLLARYYWTRLVGLIGLITDLWMCLLQPHSISSGLITSSPYFPTWLFLSRQDRSTG